MYNYNEGGKMGGGKGRGDWNGIERSGMGEEENEMVMVMVMTTIVMMIR